MLENFVNKFVVIEFTNSQRTIAYVVEVKEGFITLEAPATRKRYSMAINTIVEISELPEEQVRPEFRR